MTPAPPDNGWSTSPVTVSFTCADGLSRLASCPADLVVSTDGAYPVDATVTDQAGNVQTIILIVNLDRGPPTWNISASGTDASGRRWLEVTIDDAASGLASVTMAALANAELDIPVFASGAQPRSSSGSPSSTARRRQWRSSCLGDVAGWVVSTTMITFPPATTAVSWDELNERVTVVEATIDGTLWAASQGTAVHVAGVVVHAYSDTGFTVRAVTDQFGGFSLGVSRAFWTVWADPLPNFQAPNVGVDTTSGSIDIGLVYDEWQAYVTGFTLFFGRVADPRRRRLERVRAGHERRGRRLPHRRRDQRRGRQQLHAFGPRPARLLSPAGSRTRTCPAARGTASSSTRRSRRPRISSTTRCRFSSPAA